VQFNPLFFNPIFAAGSAEIFLIASGQDNSTSFSLTKDKKRGKVLKEAG